MSSTDTNTILVVIRHSPYGSSLSRAALDTALAAAAFEQPVQLLFMGDGVLQLLPQQDSHAIGAKNIGRQLASLPLYDIESVFAEAIAVQRYKLDLSTAPVPVQEVTAAQIHGLMSACDNVLGF
jgi:tRNA 2-thiouridine synthesizing protein C